MCIRDRLELWGALVAAAGDQEAAVALLRSLSASAADQVGPGLGSPQLRPRTETTWTSAAAQAVGPGES